MTSYRSYSWDTAPDPSSGWERYTPIQPLSRGSPRKSPGRRRCTPWRHSFGGVGTSSGPDHFSVPLTEYPLVTRPGAISVGLVVSEMICTHVPKPNCCTAQTQPVVVGRPGSQS